MRVSKLLISLLLLLGFISLASVRINDISMRFEGDLEGTVIIPYIYGIENWPTQKYFNDVVSNDLQKFLRYVTTCTEDVSKYLEEYKEKASPSVNLPFELNVSYNIGLNDSRILSFTIEYYQYTGGAHPKIDRVPYNYDLKTGNRLSVRDLFKSFHPYRSVILSEINKEIAENPEYYFVESIDYLKSDVDYYLTEDDLVIYYDYREIAPCSSRLSEFHIPLELLKEGMIDL